MIDAAKKYATRTSFAINACMIVLLGISYLAVHTGHAKADIEFPGITVGGGTEQQVAREQQLAALSNALPINAITPVQPKTPAQPPRPQEKPTVHQ
jgi:hypothetical protein